MNEIKLFMEVLPSPISKGPPNPKSPVPLVIVSVVIRIPVSRRRNVTTARII